MIPSSIQLFSLFRFSLRISSKLNSFLGIFGDRQAQIYLPSPSKGLYPHLMIAVKARGLPCIYAPLKEGDRGWGGGLGLSKNLSGIELDAAYEYLNKAQLRNSWSRCLRLGGA